MGRPKGKIKDGETHIFRGTKSIDKIINWALKEYPEEYPTKSAFLTAAIHNFFIEKESKEFLQRGV